MGVNNGMNWDAIKSAVELVKNGTVQRADGDGWKVYAVGSNVIRVDLETKKL